MKNLNTILLMLGINLGIFLTLSFVANLLGIVPYLQNGGIDFSMLLAFCLLIGMGGSFIQLLLSKTLVKMFKRVQVIDPGTTHPEGRKVYEMVRRAANRAGLSKTPEVGIYESFEVNAFATGASRENALVAVSSGLLGSMSEDAIEGVIGHEVAHIANGDMVRMTLLQGVVNSLVAFVARAVAHVVLSSGRSNDNNERPNFFAYFMLVQAIEMVLGLFGMMILAWYSRRREFRADAGGATFTTRQKMINALQALQSKSRYVDTKDESYAAFKISGRPTGFLALFSTHPSLDTRIAALQSGTYLS
jgi:heat shock protein HtpX